MLAGASSEISLKQSSKKLWFSLQVNHLKNFKGNQKNTFSESFRTSLDRSVGAHDLLVELPFLCSMTAEWRRFLLSFKDSVFLNLCFGLHMDLRLVPKSR